jgi:hypothetical protein
VDSCFVLLVKDEAVSSWTIIGTAFAVSETLLLSASRWFSPGNETFYITPKVVRESSSVILPDGVMKVKLVHFRDVVEEYMKPDYGVLEVAADETNVFPLIPLQLEVTCDPVLEDRITLCYASPFRGFSSGTCSIILTNYVKIVCIMGESFRLEQLFVDDCAGGPCINNFGKVVAIRSEVTDLDGRIHWTVGWIISKYPELCNFLRSRGITAPLPRKFCIFRILLRCPLLIICFS